MYSYKKKSKALKQYFKYESYAAVINELGHPSRGALRNWVEDHKRQGDVKEEIIRKSKYTDAQKQADEVFYLQMQKDILEKSGEIIKKDKASIWKNSRIKKKLS